MTSAGPLAGIRILEVGTMLAGPYATMLLADLGAQVTKIEPPDGDISRQVGDSYFASLNRGKRSVCLDLSTEPGRHRLGELVAETMRLVADDVTPVVLARCGHYVADEAPEGMLEALEPLLAPYAAGR